MTGVELEAADHLIKPTDRSMAKATLRLKPAGLGIRSADMCAVCTGRTSECPNLLRSPDQQFQSHPCYRTTTLSNSKVSRSSSAMRWASW